MERNRLLALLEDRETLLEAYAASSAYVLRKAYERIEALQAFKDKAALAPAVLERLEAHLEAGRPRDPVVIGAYLYALELTGARPETARAAAAVLRDPVFRQDPLVGQLAGRLGEHLTGRVAARLEPARFRTLLDPDDLERITRELGKAGEQE